MPRTKKPHAHNTRFKLCQGDVVSGEFRATPTDNKQRQKLNSNDIEYKFIKPDKSLSDFVESFWMLHNPNDTDKQVVILPDGRMDVFFSQSTTEPFHITLFLLKK